MVGKRLVKDLTSPDIVAFQRDVLAGKTASVIKTKPHGKAVVRGGPGTAARTVGLLGAILTYARSKGLIDSNPMHGVQKPADRRRDVKITPALYAALGKALADAEAAGVNPIPIRIARVLALSGCRRGEIEKLRWSEADFENRCLVLAETKTGGSVRPLGSAVLDLLDEQRAFSRRGYVFSLDGGKAPYRGFPKAWQRMIGGTEVEHLIPHGLRHGFASVAAELGYSDPVIGAILGHSSGTVTSRYTHLPDATLVHAADQISSTLLIRLRGSPP
ncbi:tyrosine-type recombinase/integrase [Rhodocista pekingensis]|uniref:Tyrosine-type recombinase/integrase n=1 Tax=Rhodocista pekingensis TaxID=201185 RepID=A0ABW2KXH5_9PROT